MTGTRVAIVGMAGRFPGADDLEQYWANLAGGVESMVELDDGQLEAAGVSAAEREHEDYVRAAYPLRDPDRFDAAFFGYTPREAEVMDPQHRVFLETALHALQDSGYAPPLAMARVGVFGGAGSNGYLHHVYTHPDIVETVGRTQVLLGNEIGFFAPRVAYKLDLHGPAISLRTACSTSLVALHLAMRALVDGECELAIAGGAFVNLAQGSGYRYQDGGFLSPDGHCRPFDADAKGTVFGSGVGAVVLKPLEAARADGDSVHAVLLGSAINNDGAGKVGFTAPAVEGQRRVITAALARAGVDASSIDYVETHGTGTPLGDPIEFQALVRAFSDLGGPPRDSPCVLGSVKSNIGHLDAASGIAGLIKVVLALRHELMPPTLHFRRPNPELSLDDSGFEVRAAATGWPRGLRPRRAAVSAFGFGGTNAHVVLEEAPDAAGVPGPARETELLVLSARTATALESATDRLAERLRRPDASLADIAFTLAEGRQTFEHRRAVLVRDTAGAVAALEARDPKVVWTRQAEPASGGVAFLLSGQGSQHPDMARALHEHEPVFRAALDECLDLVPSDLGLRAAVLPPPAADRDAAAAALRRTDIAQPALFCIEYALARLWESWGVRPTALLGHSLGELTAACLAGVFTPADALALVTLRGRLMQACPPGAMLSVSVPRDELAGRLPEGISVAAHNGARDVVVSGTHDDIERLAAALETSGLSTHAVATSHAFHSPLMAGMVGDFVTAVAAVPRRPPQVPLVSNVTGEWLTDEQAVDPGYWGRHVLSPVEFATGLQRVLASKPAALLEVGPGQILTGLARRAQPTGSAVVVAASLPHPREDLSASATAQRALGQLWTAGVQVNWPGHHGAPRRRVSLPGYPFERKRFWLDLRLEETARRSAMRRQADPADWFRTPSWSQQPGDARLIETAGRWLVLLDEVGVGAALTARLRQSGAEVVTVAAGERLTADGDAYTVRADSGSDHAQLLALLTADGTPPPGRVVHCWGVTGVDGEVELPEPAAVEQVRARSFDALLALATAWPAREPARVWVLTDGVHRVTGNEPMAPVKALVHGPCRVVPREFPAMSWASVDLDSTALGGGRPVDALLVDRLLVECSASAAEGTVALRGRTRWVQQWARHPLPPVPAQPAASLRGGVVLITGGLGAVGLELAEHLAGAGTRLVLIGRRRLPAEGAWDVVAAGAGAGAVLVRRLQQLKVTGTEVLVCQADVADVTQLRAAVEAGVARFGPIDTVVHAAGLPGGGLIQVKEPAEAHAVLRPKVDGLVGLDVLLRPGGPAASVSTVVLIGSNAANLGDFGQVDYAAANCVLDAYAHARNGPRRVVAVDYASWRRVGMAVDTPVPPALAELRRNDLEVRGMEPADALDALDRVLAWSDVPQVAVTPVDLAALLQNAFSLTEDAGELAGLRSDADAPRHGRPELAAGFVVPRTATEQTLCLAWADQLGLDRVGVDDSFFELGGNSLIALSVTQAAGEALGVRLTVARLYEAMTVARLAEIVDGTVAGPARPRPGAAPDPRTHPAETPDLVEERRLRAASRREHQLRRRGARGR